MTETTKQPAMLGIDIGGTGIKGAPVDLATGKLTAERLRIATPHPATPSAVVGVVGEIVRHFAGHDRFGCTLPSVVRNGVALTAANIDKSWIGTDGRSLLAKATGCSVVLLNDADALQARCDVRRLPDNPSLLRLSRSD